MKRLSKGAIAISIVRAAFAAAWRPALDDIGDNQCLRDRMFNLEKELADLETSIRRSCE